MNRNAHRHIDLWIEALDRADQRARLEKTTAIAERRDKRAAKHARLNAARRKTAA